jgi:hypothetical protein
MEEIDMEFGSPTVAVAMNIKKIWRSPTFWLTIVALTVFGWTMALSGNRGCMVDSHPEWNPDCDWMIRR